MATVSEGHKEDSKNKKPGERHSERGKTNLKIFEMSESARTLLHFPQLSCRSPGRIKHWAITNDSKSYFIYALCKPACPSQGSAGGHEPPSK